MKTGPKNSRRVSYTQWKRITCALLCLALMTAAVLCAAAPAEKDGRTVRVGWYDSSFNIMDEFGRRTGYAYEYQMKIAAYTGWRYEYVSGSWSDLLQMLINGEIDLMSDVSYTQERAVKMLFPSISMGSENYYLFVSQQDQEAVLADYSVLNGKKLGVNRDSVQAGFFREWQERHGVQADVVEVSCSEVESLQMLEAGELDGYITVDSFSRTVAALPSHPVPVCKIGSSDFFFAVSKKRPELLAELEYGMNRIQEENPYFSRQLEEKHLISSGANALFTPEEQTWLKNHGPIRVGYQDHYLAFCAMDPETGSLTGALKDYLERAADSVVNAQLRFDTFAYPTAQAAVDALKNGEVDCVFPANLSPGDSERMGLFMTPSLMRTDVFAVVRQSDTQSIIRREYAVAAVNEGNPNYESFLKDAFPTWRTVYFPDTGECLKAVARGVADCVLISSYRYNNIARECARENLTTVITGAGLDYCFAVNAGEPQLYSILAKTADLVPEFTANSLLSHYTSEDAKATLWEMISENPWAVIAASCAVLLVILALMLRSMKAERKASRLISATETDQLTGLYNRDYFLQYAGRMRRENPDRAMDAVVMNIDRFHAVNALNGREFGDQVLQALGFELRAASSEYAGIAGRFGADRFDLFCRHREDYQPLYERLQTRLNHLAPTSGIQLRMGVMPWQAGMEPVQLFDKARVACGMARNLPGEHLVVFDEKLQEKENLEQRLLNDLRRGLNSFELEVYYQPQYDLTSDPPKPVSAEALVRWNHPELGMIAPNDFVPLLEHHGKILEVDQYVWGAAARQTARWRELYGISVPVSVNLSRMDVFDPNLENTLDRLLAYNGLEPDMLRLEVTESAYTGNADQVIRVVESLRRKGYVVEMDDFGTGYSSLNMLSAMPVDVLKMDRAFIQRIGESEKDAQLVGLILDLARSMKIPVVAEGVENEKQLQMLKKMGCPLAQGFYFSVPLAAEDFEERVIRHMEKQKRASADPDERGDGACTP